MTREERAKFEAAGAFINKQVAAIRESQKPPSKLKPSIFEKMLAIICKMFKIKLNADDH